MLLSSCAFSGTDECHRSAYIWLKAKDMPLFSLGCRSHSRSHPQDKERSHSGLVLRSIWKTRDDWFIPRRRVGNQTDKHKQNAWMSCWITSHTMGIRSAMKNYGRPFCLQGHTLSEKWEVRLGDNDSRFSKKHFHLNLLQEGRKVRSMACWLFWDSTILCLFPVWTWGSALCPVVDPAPFLKKKKLPTVQLKTTRFEQNACVDGSLCIMYRS